MTNLIEIAPVCANGCCVAIRDLGMPVPYGRITRRMFEEFPLDYGGREYRWTPGDSYIEPPRTVK